MSVVKIVNPNPYDWRGTQYFIDGHKVPRVKSVDFHVSVDEVPTFNFEMMGAPDIELECLAQISVSSQSITDAISVVKKRDDLSLSTFIIFTKRRRKCQTMILFKSRLSKA